MVSIPPVSPPRTYTLPCPHPYAPHAQPISFSILSPAQYWLRSTNHLAPRYATLDFVYCLEYHLTAQTEIVYVITAHLQHCELPNWQAYTQVPSHHIIRIHSQHKSCHETFKNTCFVYQSNILMSSSVLRKSYLYLFCLLFCVGVKLGRSY